jgi:predicted RNA-binding protein with RPS1 domain
MDVLSHFRSIEELTKTLHREQALLSELFAKRKLIKFPLGVALDLVGGSEARLRRLVDYGVIVQTGNTVEIESDYLNFFEEVLNVNEEISVLSVQECINSLKEHIGYFLQETNVHRKAGYQDTVRQLLKKAAFRTLKNVVDLKRNVDNAYKQVPSYSVKKSMLKNFDEKSHSIRSMIRECEKLMDQEQAFFIMANDPHMAQTCSNVRHDFVEAYHALMEIDRQIIVYLNQIDQQNRLYKKIRKLKYLQDQLLLKTDTNIVQVLTDRHPLWMEPRQYSKIRLSLEALRQNDQIVALLRRVAERNGIQKMARTEALPLTDDDLAEHTHPVQEVNPTEVWNAFAASSYQLFDFILAYDYKTERTLADHATLFCQLVLTHADDCVMTGHFTTYHDIEIPVIYAK